MHFVVCIDKKSYFKKSYNQKSYNVKFQYYFAEQNNKHLEINYILLVCASSAVFLKPIHNPL